MLNPCLSLDEHADDLPGSMCFEKIQIHNDILESPVASIIKIEPE